MEKRKYVGFTLTEVLIAVGVIIIIALVVVVNFRNSDRIAELRTATDKLANDIRYIQTLALSNQKLYDIPGQVERGYDYNFTQWNRNYAVYLVYTATQTSTNYQYWYYGTNDLYTNKVRLEDILTTSDNIYTLDNQKINYSFNDLIKYFTAKAYAVAIPQMEKVSKVDYLFPGTQTVITNVYGSGVCTSGTCNSLVIYLKHDNVSNKRGKVIINSATGRVYSSIVNYP